MKTYGKFDRSVIFTNPNLFLIDLAQAHTALAHFLFVNA